MGQYDEMAEAIINGEAEKVKRIVESFISKGNDPIEIMAQGLIQPMAIVGEKMKTREMFLPEVLASANSMRGGVELIKLLIKIEESSTLYSGKAVIGTVSGDIHNIGKNIVILMLESAGFLVVDAGVDVSAEKFLQIVEKEKPGILGLSALLTNTMGQMKEVIEALNQSNLRDTIKVMVGGAPITQEFADSIGADGYAPDAGSAVEKAKALMA